MQKRQYDVCANALAGLLLTVVLNGVRGGGGDADGDHGTVAQAPRRGRRRHHIAAAESRRTSTTLDFTLGALTCSRSAPWPHLKLEQTAEVWPNSQSGEQELNVNCRAGAMRRGCGDGWRKRTVPRSIRIGLVQFPVCNICYNQRL